MWIGNLSEVGSKRGENATILSDREREREV